ncbi:hypothetical protein QQL38_11090 [Pseudomonas syringae]|uniref:hypothetical protein n=1 Tax=Pseudomonas syringae group TaxID=136849 RepID=UPI000619CDDE|nr:MULTISPECIES: hypothetical protein [Pseudomonas syringae group]MCL6308867.1 hypothetical protein [Pseudomonas syringae]
MNKKVNIAWFCFAGLFGLLAIAGVALRYTYVFSTTTYADREAWGQFGDYFGGVLNPLLSFAGFVTLLITLRMQLAANGRSEDMYQKQVREQRLFQLLDMLGNSASSAVYQPAPTDVRPALKGHVALHNAWHDFRKSIVKEVSTGQSIPLEQYRDVEKVFFIFKRTAWPSLEIFVESSFLLIDFVSKDNSLADRYTEFSMGALRVQMTEPERLLLWYSALCMPQYAHYLLVLKAFGFKGAEGPESNDPSWASADKLYECALVNANLRY